MDEAICTLWLARHLHPRGLVCPRCGDAKPRLCRAQEHFPAYRCRTCEGYDPLLTGTFGKNTRQRPAPLVLVLRGLAMGEPTARLARELGLSRTQLHPLRHRIQAHVNDTAPTGVMTGTALEADELYQNAGANKHASSRPHGSATPACAYTPGARHVCPCSSPSQPCAIPRDGRAAFRGVRPRRQAHGRGPHR
jgi:hypothetical protein